MKHGGARKGAGRPKEQPKEAITVRLDKDTANRLRLLCYDTSHSQAKILTKLINREFISILGE